MQEKLEEEQEDSDSNTKDEYYRDEKEQKASLPMQWSRFKLYSMISAARKKYLCDLSFKKKWNVQMVYIDILILL